MCHMQNDTVICYESVHREKTQKITWINQEST
jgi:hypothetical protein